MITNGWFKMPRSLIFEHFYGQGNLLSTYLALLSLVNFEDREFDSSLFSGTLKAGQYIITSHKLADMTGFHRATIFRHLTKLQRKNLINRHTCRNQAMLITVLNYSEIHGGATTPATTPATTYATTPATKKEEVRNKKEEGNSPPPPPPDPRIDDFVSLWVEEAGDRLGKPRGVSRTRRAHIKARLSENPDLEYWRQVFKNVAASDFCNGHNDRGWKASIDWVIRNDENHLKISEGKYANKNSPVSEDQTRISCEVCRGRLLLKRPDDDQIFICRYCDKHKKPEHQVHAYTKLSSWERGWPIDG